jgi:hypothetical protein
MRERDHLEKPKRGWEDDIKVDLKEVEWAAWTGSG